MSIDRSSLRGLVRAIAYDARGARLGRVAQVFLDDRSDEPAWVAVDVTRVRGMRLLPLAGAALRGRHLVIRAQRSTVRSAPRIDLADGQLSSQDESRLLEHFGLGPAGQQDDAGTGEQRPASPWPDDTERETAWERPVQWQQDTPAPPAATAPAAPTDTRPVAPVTQGWDQPSAGSTAIGDRSQTPHEPGPDQVPTPGQQRDTELSGTFPTATPAPRSSEPRSDADGPAR